VEHLTQPDPVPSMRTPPTNVTAHVRDRLRHAFVQGLKGSGALRGARAQIAKEGTLVLMLHRVIPDNALPVCRSPRGMVMRESAFRSMMDYLRQHTSLITPGDFLLRPKDEKRPRVMVTFDDGWADNYAVAAPVLEAQGARACFFVVTEYAGMPHPFWPERLLGLLRVLQKNGRGDLIEPMLNAIALKLEHPHPSGRHLQEEQLLKWMKQFSAAKIGVAIDGAVRNLESIWRTDTLDPLERLMTWDELRSLAHRGHRIASHTATHALLTTIAAQEMVTQLRGSAVALETQLKEECASFDWIAYPNGNVDARVRKAAVLNGYRFGFTTSAGIWRSNGDMLNIPRVNVWDGSVLSAEGEFDESYLEYSLFWRPLRSRRR